MITVLKINDPEDKDAARILMMRGNAWKIIGRCRRVTFSEKKGPWLLLSTESSMMWVHAFKDDRFSLFTYTGNEEGQSEAELEEELEFRGSDIEKMVVLAQEKKKMSNRGEGASLARELFRVIPGFSLIALGFLVAEEFWAKSAIISAGSTLALSSLWSVAGKEHPLRSEVIRGVVVFAMLYGLAYVKHVFF